MDIAKALRAHNEQQHRLVERALVAENIAEELEKSLAPRGTYNIPFILDERRFEYGIPNGAFEQFPAFDKVFIWQLNTSERKTYTSGGTIIKPEARIAYDRNTAPRGVIVSAGLQALDSLRSSGIDVGHVVRFKKFSPFIMPVAEIQGVELAVMVIRDGDIVSSEDLGNLYNKRIVSIVNVAKDQDGYDFRFASINSDGEESISHSGKKVAAYYDPSV